jgi:branched-chain amino acid transport system substrate-binding protein
MFRGITARALTTVMSLALLAPMAAAQVETPAPKAPTAPKAAPKAAPKPATGATAPATTTPTRTPKVAAPAAAAAGATAAAATTEAPAAKPATDAPLETVKVGLILPMTGPFASTGRQIEAGVKLYMSEYGDTVAGKKIELIVKDDTNVADVTKRLAQDMIVNDGVKVIAGFGLTPLALAAAPISAKAKVPQIVMAAGTSIITEKSPYIVRTSFTVPQKAATMGTWAARNGVTKVYSLVSDFAPGHDAEKWFKDSFSKGGGQMVGESRVPLANPDFAPFLQRAADAKPDAIFVFVPSGQGATFAKQYAERGLDKSGIKLIATGDVTDDDILNNFGDSALGVLTADPYSASHTSDKNMVYVRDFRKANGGMRPNFMSVGGYDGMHLIYEALKKSNGKTDGDSLIAAMKGMTFESPRGIITIDADTRDITQTVFVRRVERVNGELYNIEFDAIEQVKDPGKTQ